VIKTLSTLDYHFHWRVFCRGCGGCLKRKFFSASSLDTSKPDLDIHVKSLQSPDDPLLLQWETTFHLTCDPSNNLWKDTALIVVENNDLRRGILHHFHSSLTAGHPGISKTIQLIQPHYWWPCMKDFITEYVKGCALCQMNKINTHPTHPPIFPITTSSTLPFQTISLDFITKLPPSYGYDTILTITDHDISKASIFLPCKEMIDAVGIAELYATHVFLHYGVPLKVISDRDPHFDLAFTTDLCKLLGVRQNISSAYHLQTDGQSERTNQSLETYLQLYCDTQQHEWAKLLPMAQYVRNLWPSITTKQVPFNTLIGYTPQAHQPTCSSHIPNLQQRLKNIKESRTAALEAIRKVQEKQEQVLTRFKDFSIGDKVWLEGTNLKRIEGTLKLSPRRYGPFKVAAKISHVTYRINLPKAWKIHNVFHASLLTLLQSETTPTSFSFIPVEPAPLPNAPPSLPSSCPDSLLPILPVPPPKLRLSSLLRGYPYTTHKFHDFKPKSCVHVTHSHSLEHQHFCKERFCPSHRPYGG
jgi:hypothetical protein